MVPLHFQDLAKGRGDRCQSGLELAKDKNIFLSPTSLKEINIVTKIMVEILLKFLVVEIWL